MDTPPERSSVNLTIEWGTLIVFGSGAVFSGVALANGGGGGEWFAFVCCVTGVGLTVPSLISGHKDLNNN